MLEGLPEILPGEEPVYAGDIRPVRLYSRTKDRWYELARKVRPDWNDQQLAESWNQFEGCRERRDS